MKTFISIFVLSLFVFIQTGNAADILHHSEGDSVSLIPYPKYLTLSDSSFVLPKTLNVYADQKNLRPLISVIDYEYKMLRGGRAKSVSSPEEASLILRMNELPDKDSYQLEVGDTVIIAGSNYASVAAGSATLMQLLSGTAGKNKVPRGVIEDSPDSKYRGLLIDVARNWHEPAILRQIILLCRWYKINHLQLHLTDNELFTFPTETFPKLPTPDLHYTKEQLRELDRFARHHGVTLVPEIEVPGHAGQFVNRMPGLFGIEDWQKNDITINMGKEEVYEALGKIIGEVSEVFQTSPYIHIGADEAGFSHFEEDPDVKAYLENNNLEDVNELYRHFLVRMNNIVKEHGKETIVWEGFAREDNVQIPRDVIVMAWETLYQLPQHLIADGYTTINVSWQPLYITTDRKWSPVDIYQWNMYRWENWLKEAPAYEPIQLEPTRQIIGASMASWAQEQHLELPTITRRLPAFSERTWNATLKPERSKAWFEEVSTQTDSAFGKFISPIRIKTDGLIYPDLKEGRKNEQYWFDDELTLRLDDQSKYKVRYTLDGSNVTNTSPEYTKPIKVNETTSLKAKTYTPGGEPYGYTVFCKYEFHPLHAEVEGSLLLPLSELWKTKRSWEAPFKDSVNIQLTSGREGIIRFTTDGSEADINAERYTQPITITQTAVVTAQLFNQNGQPLGKPWRQHFRKSNNAQY